jgi:hypothetical protein
VEAERHFTGGLGADHSGKQQADADKRHAKNSHDSHEIQVGFA